MTFIVIVEGRGPDSAPVHRRCFQSLREALAWAKERGGEAVMVEMSESGNVVHNYAIHDGAIHQEW